MMSNQPTNQSAPLPMQPPKSLPNDAPQSESAADVSERAVKEEAFILPSNNDGYHEKILSLLKIANNKPLNSLYYKVVPQINKGSLLMLDLSASLNDSRVKTFVDTLLPDPLFKELPAKDVNVNYYDQYCQLAIANLVMQHQIKRLLAERQEMHQKLRTQRREEEAKSSKPVDDESISSSAAMSMPLSSQLQPMLQQKQKRHRRTANEIERHYRCPIGSCAKSYGSEGSLNQHIKLKHPEFYYAQTAKPAAAVVPAPNEGQAPNPVP